MCNILKPRDQKSVFLSFFFLFFFLLWQHVGYFLWLFSFVYLNYKLAPRFYSETTLLSQCFCTEFLAGMGCSFMAIVLGSFRQLYSWDCLFHWCEWASLSYYLFPACYLSKGKSSTFIWLATISTCWNLDLTYHLMGPKRKA